MVWPADVRRWMHSERAAVSTVPSLVPGLPPERQEVPLQADASGERLSWFVDGAFVGTHPAEERVWWTPTRGDHEVVVVDEAGLSARRAFWVR